jgi:hypothetical protein
VFVFCRGPPWIRWGGFFVRLPHSPDPRDDGPVLKVSLNMPTKIRLKLNGEKVKKKAGQRLATTIRARLRRGVDGDGTKMPEPEDGGSALKDSGKLLRSIKYRQIPAKRGSAKKVRVVAPSTTRRSDISKRAHGNFGLMSIHTAKEEYEDPMGQNDPGTAKVLEDAATKEIARQLAKGEGGLKLELKHTLRGARRGARRR